MSFWKSVKKVLGIAAPVAALAIPFVGPALGTAFGALGLGSAAGVFGGSGWILPGDQPTISYPLPSGSDVSQMSTSVLSYLQNRDRAQLAEKQLEAQIAAASAMQFTAGRTGYYPPGATPALDVEALTANIKQSLGLSPRTEQSAYWGFDGGGGGDKTLLIGGGLLLAAVLLTR